MCTNEELLEVTRVIKDIINHPTHMKMSITNEELMNWLQRIDKKLNRIEMHLKTTDDYKPWHYDTGPAQPLTKKPKPPDYVIPPVTCEGGR